MGVADRAEAKASESSWGEHEHLSQVARVQAAKLESMHIVDWEEAQEAEAPPPPQLHAASGRVSGRTHCLHSGIPSSRSAFE